MNNVHVDIVLAWVDGNDPVWREEKARYTPNGDAGINRFRDWDNLQYWFRGVEKFAPWVRTIHFVTYGHLPPWLKINHPRLQVVKHEDYIPQKYLPTYSSHTIEMNFHRMKELSEQFIYCNDDMFFIAPVAESDFFKKGLPVDACVETALQFKGEPIDRIIAADLDVVNRHFTKRRLQKKMCGKWFSPHNGKGVLNNVYLAPLANIAGFRNPHLPTPYLKSTWEKIWKEEPALLDKTCRNRFRSTEDVNQWLCRYWQFASGNFVPGSSKLGKFLSIGDQDGLIEQILTNQSCKTVCLSDDRLDMDFEAEKAYLCRLFEQILPQPSSFEKQEVEYA